MNASPLAPTAIRPPIAILGVPFDNVTTDDTLRLIGEMIVSRKPHYLATANVDFVVQAQSDLELRRILFDAHLVVADGMPLVWASRWLGNPLPERVTGSDLTPLLLALAEEKGWSVFFLGGTEQSVEQARVKTLAKHPKLRLWAYSPPLGRLGDAQTDDPMNNAEILRRLREAKPDILLVAFGCPKQERWIYANYIVAKVPVSIGVGATIDFLAGTMRRAPAWMQKTGLEWIFRMLQEPQRLFRRYAVDLWTFGWGIFGQLRQMRAGRAARRRAAATPITLPPGTTAWRIKLPACLDAAAVAANEAAWRQSQSAGVLLDASAMEFMDSTGVGLLIRLQKRARAQGRQLIIAAPSANLRKTLKLMKLDEFFTQLPDVPSALQALSNQDKTANVLMDLDIGSQRETALWQGEITAVNAGEIALLTSALLQQATGAFTVNLSGLRFIDTTGIGLMVKLKKQAVRQGVALHFTGASSTIRKIVSLLRMEEYLFGISI
jgi:N-acetylglucosaminyldiphosphoundecaprenol N-acetyl-beta-D-mannosaminyltransferase